ncbi:hypothetical protein BH11VER1_BH11VER1_17860 [soil metagenome]
MPTLLESVTANRLGGDSCPDDLRILLTDGIDLLHGLDIELSGDLSWQPWADKSYLTASDLADPDIAANVRAIDDTFKHINFVARTEDDICIGYWRGPHQAPLAISPLVSYDTEGQFRLCGGRFAESLFFLLSDDEALEQFRDSCLDLGIVLSFESLDDIAIPSLDPTPEAFHLARYNAHKVA